MAAIEYFVKTGLVLLIGIILLSGLFSTALSSIFVSLGRFLIIMAFIIAGIAFLIPLLKRLL